MKKIITNVFALTLLLSVATSSQLKASIVYTDVNPDSVGTGNTTITWDMNNDGTSDYRITMAAVSGAAFAIVQAGQVGINNFVLVSGSNDAQALALNTMISSSSTTWYQMNSTNALMVSVLSGNATGTWATNRYVPGPEIRCRNKHLLWLGTFVS